MLHRLKQLIKKIVRRLFEIGGFNVVRPQVLEQLSSALQKQEHLAAELGLLKREVAALKESTLGKREPREIVRMLHALSNQTRYAAARPSDASDVLRGLAHHYAVCANLVAEHGLFRGQQIADPFIGDDCTVDFVKKTGIYVPGNEVDPHPSSAIFAWSDMFADPECGVFLIMGQSNAGNHGAERYQPTREVYALNFMNMKCYRATDPLPGASGEGGSVWSRLGDRLVESGQYKRVLFVPLAFGGSFVTDWTPGGTLNRRLALALSRLHKWLGQDFLSFTAAIWQQGEAEANHTNMSADDYRQNTLEVIADLRSRGVFCPIFTSISTTCEAGSHPHKNHVAIRQAQSMLPEPRIGVLPGPDTDSIGESGRHDGCHFSATGLQTCSDLWFDTFRKAQPLLRNTKAMP
jgi:hypothetical protein